MKLLERYILRRAAVFSTASLAALVLVPGFVLAITRRFISREEAWLRARDPAGFARWAARTRRWL